jgi:hypothetical protein
MAQVFLEGKDLRTGAARLLQRGQRMPRAKSCAFSRHRVGLDYAHRTG